MCQRKTYIEGYNYQLNTAKAKKKKKKLYHRKEKVNSQE